MIMNKRRAIDLAMMCFFAFAGGMVSEQLFSKPAYAALSESLSSFHDSGGTTRLSVGVYNGQPQENIMGEDGKLRMQLGTYDGSVIAGEKGLPVMTFSDNLGRLKMLLRIAPGNNQSPVLVMKDNKQNDRIVMGLSLNGASKEPFLVYFDSSGNKHAVFGTF
jgi:hypothetical protein